jgi:hypothetical protein
VASDPASPISPAKCCEFEALYAFLNSAQDAAGAGLNPNV